MADAMTKTLGGDRLGSGKKMKVHLHGYERSTHDLGYVWRTTMAAGTLVPFLKQIALPGDTFDINLHMDGKTHPTIGPLFGSYKVQLDVFLAPIRLYNAQLHNNTLGIGKNMSAVKIPQIEFGVKGTADPTTLDDFDNSQINPSSLPAYLGIRGIGWHDDPETTVARTFNCIPILAYWEIYKNYYANKQEEIGAVIHTTAVANIETVDAVKIINGATESTLAEDPALSSINLQQYTALKIEFTGAQPDPAQIYVNTTQHGSVTLEQLGLTWTLTAVGVLGAMYNLTEYGFQQAINWRYRQSSDTANGQPQIATFPLENIDKTRQDILAKWDQSVTPYKITSGNWHPYDWLVESENNIPNILSSQEGLALKTYQSDLFNNWLKTENIEAISVATAIDTTGGSFTIDQFILSNKVYKMLNRINVSGGSYDDWLDAVYTHDRYQRCESPMYMGGLIKELVFQEVVSNSESESGQPLGTLAGKGVMSSKHKGGTVVIKVDEPAYIMGIVSITPRIDYSQGNDWDTHLETMDDLHKPALDEIGFQDLITEQMAWWDTTYDGTDWVQKSAGKQPAWLNYMTQYNKCYGNFAVPSNEMFMTLNRRYENNTSIPTIADLTTYIDPSKFNFIFAETQLDAQNFWVQIAVDITARRKMSAKIMPNL